MYHLYTIANRHCLQTIKTLSTHTIHKHAIKIHNNMIIECEFTNATNFVRERVVFLTDFQIMIESENLIYAVYWDGYFASIAKLNQAMHDSEFRIHLDRESLRMTLARSLGTDWTYEIQFIAVDWRPRNKIYSKLHTLQRFLRHGIMIRRLSFDKIYSRATASYKQLMNRLQGNSDVVMMIVQHFLLFTNTTTTTTITTFNMKSTVVTHIVPHNSPLKWIKPDGDGHIFA